MRSVTAGHRITTTPDIPDEFVEIVDCLPAQIDRQLGYFGQCRFVAFRYEPRAEDVMWTDERSFGISTGAWQLFYREISSLAGIYDVNVGGENDTAEQVLVCDRVKVTAYFAPRTSAEAFLARRRELLPNVA
jgi:V8-like Glu-specific endopeptidase